MVTQVPQLYVQTGLAKIKPHVKYWCHGLYFADADGIASAGYSIPEAISRWQDRWLSMDLIAPLKRDVNVRQYYYRVPGCAAITCDQPSCTCWHDEGTGPLGDEAMNRKFGLSSINLPWRDKP